MPSTDDFGPQTLVASGELSGLPETSTLMYVTNAWSQHRGGAALTGDEANDQVFANHLGLNASNYLAPSWSFNAGSPVASSVDVVDGVAYFADAHGAVDAVNIQTGVQKWSSTVVAASRFDTAPVVVGGLVVVGAVNHDVYALDASTGKVVWTTKLSGAVESSPSADGSDIYLGADNGDVYALKTTTGKLVWTASTGGKVTGSVALDTANGLAVVGGHGTVWAFALTTGARRWKYATGGSITASPALSSGTAYIGSSNGTEYALNESTGALRWKHATGAPVTVSTTLANGEAVVASGDSVFYLNESSGAVKVSVVESDTVVGTAGASNFVVSELADGVIGGTRPLTHDLQAWAASLGTSLTSSPTIVNGEVIVTGTDGTVQCWRVPGSRPV